MTRHFLTVDDLTVAELAKVLDAADDLKATRSSHGIPLAGKTVALIFEKPSTRTRVSAEVAIAELGAHPVVLAAEQLQLGRGEPIADTARVLSSYVDAIGVRTFAQDRLEELAQHGRVPVINLLSDHAHPCQALADLQTIREYKGTLAGLKLCYLGDGNNVAHSLLRAGAMAGMHVVVATPPGYGPDPIVLAQATELALETDGSVAAVHDAAEAAANADVLYTDVWASMGQEHEAEARRGVFAPYRLDADAVARARPDALVMHCLPAHRGEEITADVLEGASSVVWSQAANRLHTTKALLLWLLERS